jgi:large subunit ribosomal protein L10
MTREQKKAIIDSLTEQINKSTHFYLTDISQLNAADTSALRRQCFNNDIKLVVVKNTLLTKALEKSNKNVEEIKTVLSYSTSVMFCETGNAPAKLIQDFRRQNQKPILKAAYVEESVYIGDNQVAALVNIKSKNELIADLIFLLQSPMKTVLGQLESGKHIIGGLVKTLSERE